jgi:hypothetical protein
MMKSLESPIAQLVAGLLLGLATAGAFLVGGDAVAGLVGGGLVIALILAVHFGRRRSQTLEVMGGIGDERVHHLYVGATAFTGSVMALVLPVWWLVTVAQGDPNETLGLVCALFGVVWLAAVIVLPRS